MPWSSGDSLSPSNLNRRGYGASGIYNVKEYGTTSDGSTNDATAINLAIAAAESTVTVNSANKNEVMLGSVVYMPPGNYAIGSPLTISKSGIELCGAGKGMTSLIPTGGGSAVIVGDGTTANRPLDVTLRDFKVSYNDQFPSTVGTVSAATTDTPAILFQTADQLNIENVAVFFDINNTVQGLRGFKFDDCELVTMRNCEAHELGGQSTGTESVALHITNSAANHGNFHVDSFYARKAQVGLKLDSSNLLNSLVFTNFKVVNASMGASNVPKYGVWIGGNVVGTQFLAPHIEGQSGKSFYDAFFFDSSEAVIDNCVIMNALVSRCSDTAFDLADSTNTIRNVHIYNTTLTGSAGETMPVAFDVGAKVEDTWIVGAARTAVSITTFLADSSVTGSHNLFAWKASSIASDVQDWKLRGAITVDSITTLS